jgi:hypothetical protein
MLILDYKLNSQLRAERENLRKQEEYYNGKLRDRSAHEKEREKTMMELLGESQRIREHYRDGPMPVTVVNPGTQRSLPSFRMPKGASRRVMAN